MRKVIKYSLLTLVGLCVLLLALPTALYLTADMKQPHEVVDTSSVEVVVRGDSVRLTTRGSLVRTPYGLWEGRVSGTPLERGLHLGVLQRDLLEYQEAAFVEQIRRFVPSQKYLWLLHKLTIIFNRRMADHIDEELRQEIHALSASCSHRFDDFGTPYFRQLNYHAAHDIGHAMQEYMLVGCSAFAVRGGASEDGNLLVGRNFDFWVGDAFAENKVVMMVEPTEGYRYLSVTWPGMVGVVSGMNERGLTVTINAAKGAIPTSSAMPISLLTRRILQYASTIEEAYRMACEAETFVSESILVASGEENRAVVIEKSPAQTALYAPATERLVVTNHYQSEAFATDGYNLENIASSDSPYRHARLTELLTEAGRLTPEGAAAVLRNRYGMGGRDIGLTNEKSINQAIAHHAVIFQPVERRVWVSTAPWQAGAMLCYDLDEVFAAPADGQTRYDAMRTIAPDSAFLINDYPRVTAYRALSQHLQQQPDTSLVDSLVKLNPNYFGTYELAGDCYAAEGRTAEAVALWHEALECETARLSDRQKIEQKIQDYGKR